jgi:hypothetical protein
VLASTAPAHGSRQRPQHTPCARLYLQRVVDVCLVGVAVDHELRQHVHGDDVVRHPLRARACARVRARVRVRVRVRVCVCACVFPGG